MSTRYWILLNMGVSNHVPIEDEDYQQKRLIVIELLDFLPQLRDIFQGKDMDVFGCKLGNPSNFSQKLFSFWNSTFDGRDPVNSPVEVGSLSHHSQGFSTIPGGCLETEERVFTAWVVDIAPPLRAFTSEGPPRYQFRRFQKTAASASVLWLW